MSLDFSSTRGAHPTPDLEKGFSAVAALGALDGLSRGGGGRDLPLGAAHAQTLVRQRTFDFPDAMLDRLKIQAERDGISQGEAVRQALAAYLSANQTPYPQPTSPHVGTPTSQPTGGHVGSESVPSHQHAHQPARGEPRARVDESSLPFTTEEETARGDVETWKSARPRNEFIDAAVAVFVEVDALPTAAGLLQKWRKELFKGDGAWMLRGLRDLAPRGVLGKGDGYVFKALENFAAGRPPGNGRFEKPPDIRRTAGAHAGEQVIVNYSRYEPKEGG